MYKRQSPASTRKLAGLPSNKDTQTADQLGLVVEVVEAAAATAAEDEREDAAEALAVAEALRGNGRRTPVTVLLQVVALFAITATRRATYDPTARTLTSPRRTSRR